MEGTYAQLNSYLQICGCLQDIERTNTKKQRGKNWMGSPQSRRPGKGEGGVPFKPDQMYCTTGSSSQYNIIYLHWSSTTRASKKQNRKKLDGFAAVKEAWHGGEGEGGVPFKPAQMYCTTGSSSQYNIIYLHWSSVLLGPRSKTAKFVLLTVRPLPQGILPFI
jgi:hypothetical protein